MMASTSSKLESEDLVLLILQASDDCQIDGRTTIQKIAYFAVCNLKIDNDFIPHYFGPYSTQILSSLEELVSLRLVEERATITHNDRKMYSYRLTEDGRAYSSSLLKTYKREFLTIKKIVDCVKEIRGDRTTRLSCAAKIHYLSTATKEKLTLQSAIEKAKSLGWNLGEKQIISAISTLHSMK